MALPNEIAPCYFQIGGESNEKVIFFFFPLPAYNVISLKIISGGQLSGFIALIALLKSEDDSCHPGGRHYVSLGLRFPTYKMSGSGRRVFSVAPVPKIG